LAVGVYFFGESRQARALGDWQLETAQAELQADRDLLTDDLQKRLEQLTLARHLLEQGSATPASLLQGLMLSDSLVTQARHIGEDGRERARIDRAGSGLRAATPEDLQDKAHRDYTQALLALPAGHAHVSRIELNREHGKLSSPHQPVLRLGVRLEHGQGFLITNLDATGWLDRVARISARDHELWMVTPEGDWLEGPEDALEWGFELGQRHTLGDHLPVQAAETLLEPDGGTVVQADHTIYTSLPLDSALTGPVHYASVPVLVAHHPPSALLDRLAAVRAITRPLFGFVLPLAGLLGLVALRRRRSLETRAWALQADREALDGFQDLAHAVPQLTWTANESGTCDFVNGRFEEFTGKPAAELIGDGWLDCLHPDDRDMWVGAWNHTLHTGSDMQVRLRLRLQAADGQWRTFSSQLRTIHKPGRPVRYVGTHTDIQEAIDFQHTLEAERNRLRAELGVTLAARQAALDQLRVAATAAGLGFFRRERGAPHLTIDAHVGALMGLPHTPPGPTVDEWLERIHPADQARVLEEIRALLRSRTSGAVRGRLAETGGGPRWIELTVAPSADGSQTVGVIREVTDEVTHAAELRSARDAAVDSARAKASFLANMSHEIRTPLNGVLGMLTALLESPLTEPQRDQLTKAHLSAERLLLILNDILDLSRIDAGHLSIQPAPVFLEDLVATAVDVFSATAQQKGVTLRVRLAPGTPVRIRTDALRLGQVVSNIVGNAIKFTPSGGRVTVALAEQPGPDGPQLRVSVRDTGIGMQKDQLDRIYTAFAQAHDGIHRDYGGTGLGLTISHRIVEMMGGSIEVTSTPGEGTTFRVRVPYEPLDGAAPDPSQPTTGMVVVGTAPPGPVKALLESQLPQWGAKLSLVGDLDAVAAAVQTPTHGSRAVFVDLSAHDTELPAAHCAQLESIAARLHAQDRLLLCISARLPARAYPVTQLPSVDLVRSPVTPSRLYDCLVKRLRTRDAGASLDAAHTLSELRVLSVDDVRLNRQVVDALLGRHLARLVNVGSGSEALEALQSQSFDLVLMDVQMAGMSGLEATRHIRELPLPTQPLVVGLSASSCQEDREAALAAGMDDYITKPFLLDDLVRTLAQHLRAGPSEAAPARSPEASRQAGHAGAAPAPGP
jgi:PAS domain S-box-containing protein